MEYAPNKKLSEFKKVVTYSFEETKFSKLSKEKVWKSFGFNLSKKEEYNNQWVSRLWLSRTQRRISRGDKAPSKQRMTHDTSIAEKVGLYKKTISIPSAINKAPRNWRWNLAH